MADLFSNPNDLALASMGLRLMSTPGKLGPALGTSGLGALQDLQWAQQVAKQRQMQERILSERQEELRRKRAEEDAAKLRESQIESAYRGAFVSPAEQALAGGGGPTQANAQAMQGMRPRVDTDRLIEGLMKIDPRLAFQMAQPKDVEIKEYREIRMPDGSVQVVGFGKDGKPVNTGQTPFKAPEVRDFGGHVGGIDLITGKVTRFGDKSQSPDSRASNAVTMRGQNMNDARERERLAFDASRPAGGEKPSAAQERDELDRQKKGRQSEQMLAAISEARTLLAKKPTASGVGAGVDFLGRQVGLSTGGDRVAAQLETLSGWMVANVPRMEGPQSNFDVENYKTMAAKVGDRTVPIPSRLAALDTLEGLHRKYAEINGTPLPSGGASGGWDLPTPVRRYNPATGRIE